MHCNKNMSAYNFQFLKSLCIFWCLFFAPTHTILSPMNGERDIWHFDILDDVDDEKIHVAKKISSKIESLGLSILCNSLGFLIIFFAKKLCYILSYYVWVFEEFLSIFLCNWSFYDWWWLINHRDTICIRS